MIQNASYSYKNIWCVAYPILISLVMEQMIGMTDTAFLGRVGEVELGASAIASVYYMVIFMTGFGFSLGAQIIIGRRNGERNYSQTGQIFYQGTYFLVALALVIVLLSELFSPWLMGKIVSSPNIREAALDYVRWRIPSLFFAFVTAMFRAFYVGTTQTRTLTLNSIIMVLSNVVFNWILIFGIGSSDGGYYLEPLGIKGAAIGSTLAELVSLIFFIVHTVRKTDCRKYGLSVPAKFDGGELKRMFSVSAWTMVQSFLSVSTWLIFFLYVEHLGERSLAVSNIVRNVSGLIWMVMMAFSSTCSTLVSNIIGEGHPESVKSLLKRLLKITYAIIIAMIVIFAAFPKAVIGIYTDIPDIITDTVPSMLVMCSAYIFTIPANIFFQTVSGSGNTKKAFLLEAVALAVYMVYCTVVVGIMKADVAICWTAEHIYSIAMAVLCGLYLRSGKWKNKKI